ncbi:MAG: fumarylacetoacetate hydrolase family protein [Granulosicoccus sp.]|nr:fumarylacetoacetate hydrolase family protein [Granulosicoccus sp.]
MKLLRCGEAGSEKPAALDEDGRIRDLSSHLEDIGPEQLDDATLSQLAAIDLKSLPAVPASIRRGPPVNGVRKIVCIGLNYSDHAAESGLPIPEEPVVFMKADTSICGPNDDVIMPMVSKKLDWEVELGMIIGKTAHYVEENEALQYVAGYCVVNDVSEREFQIEGTGQWVKGKSHDSFCPFGPELTTRDEIPDPQALDLWLDVDGQRMQSGSTSRMIFSCAHIISFLSRFMTLRAGDLVITGTPPGVGLGMKPPRYLKLGERMTLGIQGLGEISQKVVAHPKHS